MIMNNALKAARDWFRRQCTQRARFEKIGQPRASSLPCGPMALASLNAGEPLEDRIRCRFMLAANAAAQIRAGKRKDHAAVVRELRRAFDELSFVTTILPELAGNFTIRTALECLSGRIEELESLIERLAEKARADADDDDNGETYV